MNKNILLLLSFLLSFYSFSQSENTDLIKLNVNTESSNLNWIGSKIYENHEGTVDIQSGFLIFDAENSIIGGEFVFDMNTIYTTDIKTEKYRKKLDDHLKNEDFFNVENFSTSSLEILKAFKLDEVIDIAGNKNELWRISADLTIKDITRKIIFEATLNKNKSAVQARANFKIDRTDWDIKYKSGSIFDELGDKAILDDIEFEIFLISEK